MFYCNNKKTFCITGIQGGIFVAQTTISKQASPLPLRLFLLISPFFFGGFYEPLSCLFSVFLTGYLLYCQRKNGRLYICKNLPLLSLAVLTAAYFLSPFWAVDKGMAILGFFKFLPFLLFAAAVMQIDSSEQTDLLNTVPLSGSIMTVLSFALGRIPFLKDIFLVNHRLAGFFQYPNTFALFLLAGILIQMGKNHFDKKTLFCLAVLLFGIMQTGSRAVFLILLILIPLGCIFIKEKKARRILLLLLITAVAATLVYTILTGNTQNIGRYLTSSLNSSTFLGRLLYFKDALPVILSHPFGLGYMGYYYTQGSFQTGVYSVLNIHNEFLQLLLDVGWIPAFLFFAAVIRAVFSKQTAWNCRLLLIAVLGHCMFDFDLQFVVIGFLLITIFNLHTKAVWTLKKCPVQILAVLTVCSCLWFGLASGFFYCGSPNTAVLFYSGYTRAWQELLPESETIGQMEETADKILSYNSSVALVYSAKAKTAYSEGDFEHMIIYKKQAISLSKYVLEEYLDYFDMLLIGVQLYTENQDFQSAEYCRRCILEIPDMLKAVLDSTDSLAWKINDKPKLILPDKYQEIIDTLQASFI